MRNRSRSIYALLDNFDIILDADGQAVVVLLLGTSESLQQIASPPIAG